MMNVDCDMYANNPKVILHALCLLLEPKNQREVAFVQCPQVFYDALKDDPFGNQLTTMFEVHHISIYIVLILTENGFSFQTFDYIYV